MEDERETPRTLLDRILQSHSVEQTERIPRHRSRQRTPQSNDTHGDRAGLKPKMTNTEADTTTPRTLIEGFMANHDTVHQSLRKKPRIEATPKESPKKTSRLNKSLQNSLRKKATMKHFMKQNLSLNQGPTPRTLIENLLSQASEETPVVAAGADIVAAVSLEETILSSLPSAGGTAQAEPASDNSVTEDSYLESFIPSQKQRRSLGAGLFNQRRARIASSALSQEAFIEALANIQESPVSEITTPQKSPGSSRPRVPTPEDLKKRRAEAGLNTDTTPRSGSAVVSSRTPRSSGQQVPLPTPQSIAKTLQSIMKTPSKSAEQTPQSPPKTPFKTPHSSAKTLRSATKSPFKTPQSSTKTPHSSMKTPQSSTKTPQSSTKTPQSSTKTPQSSTKTPQSSTKTPFKTPHSAFKVPQSLPRSTPRSTAKATPSSAKRSGVKSPGSSAIKDAFNKMKKQSITTPSPDDADRRRRSTLEAGDSVERSVRVHSRPVPDRLAPAGDGGRRSGDDASDNDETPASVLPPQLAGLDSPRLRKSSSRTYSGRKRSLSVTPAKRQDDEDEEDVRSRLDGEDFTPDVSRKMSPAKRSSLSASRRRVSTGRDSTLSPRSSRVTPRGSGRRDDNDDGGNGVSTTLDTVSPHARSRRSTSRETLVPPSDDDEARELRSRLTGRVSRRQLLADAAAETERMDASALRISTGVVEATATGDRDAADVEAEPPVIVSIQPVHPRSNSAADDSPPHLTLEHEPAGEAVDDAADDNDDQETSPTIANQTPTKSRRTPATAGPSSDRQRRLSLASTGRSKSRRESADEEETPGSSRRETEETPGTSYSRPGTSRLSGAYDSLVTPRLPSGLPTSARVLTPYQLIQQQRGAATKTPVKRTAPKTTATKRPGQAARRPASVAPRIPRSLVKDMFERFMGAKVTRDTIAEVEKLSDVFWQNVADDLEAYTAHARPRRNTVNEADVELLMRRQRLVSGRASMHGLVEQYLPLQYQRMIIPCAIAGNKVTPAPKSPQR